jgi:hypothetical protein
MSSPECRHRSGDRWNGHIIPVLIITSVLFGACSNRANVPASKPGADQTNTFTIEQVKKILMSKTWNLASDDSYYISGYKSVEDYTDLSVQAPSPAPFNEKYQVEYDAIRQAASEGRNVVDLKAGCRKVGIPFGVPHNLPYGTRNFIFTDDNRLYIEIGNGPREFRKVWMDGRPLPDVIHMLLFQGYSSGHWDGSSFIVKTVGLRNDVQAEDGMVLSDQLSVEERYTLEDQNRIRLDLVLTDPVKFTKPWKPGPIYYFPEDQGDVQEQWLTFLDDACDNDRSNYVDGQTRLLDSQGRDLGRDPINVE